MLKKLAFWLHEYTKILLAPFIYHFGHVGIVNDACVAIANLNTAQLLFFWFCLGLVVVFIVKNFNLTVFKTYVFNPLALFFNNYLLTPLNRSFLFIKKAFITIKAFFKSFF